MAAIDPGRARALVALLSAGNFVIGVGAFVVIGILPPLREGLALTVEQSGLVMTAYALAYMVGSPVGVAITGPLARRTVLCAGMALFGAAAALSALAPDLWTLLAARVLAAFGAGLVTPVSAGVAIAVSPPERRGQALSAVFFGLTLAQVLGIPAGGYIGFAFGWQIAFWAVAALAAACLAGFLLLVPQAVPFQVNTLATLGRALADVRGLIAILFTATFLGAIYILYTFMTLLLTERQGFGGAGVALYLAVYGVGAVIGNLLGGRAADRIGAARTLTGLVILQALLMPAFALLPMSDLALCGLGFVWALFGWSFMVPQQTRLVALFPDRQNVVIALNASAIYLGAVMGSSLGAILIGAAGIGWLGLWAGLAMLPVLGHLLLSLRVSRQGSAAPGRA
jgi:predicted MFS family arabinose efflux permease